MLLVGESADRFAEERGLEPIAPEELVAAAPSSAARAESSPGTVGAVARDGEGRLVAATSTGGTRAKRAGRVGDTPLIGAGTWADDNTCAVSATGDGEHFIRAAFAHEVDARLRLGGETLERACRAALERVRDQGGLGGCVSLAARGPAVLQCSTLGMPRGAIDASGVARIAVYADEALEKS